MNVRRRKVLSRLFNMEFKAFWSWSEVSSGPGPAGRTVVVGRKQMFSLELSSRPYWMGSRRTLGLLCVSPFSQTKRDRPNGSQLLVGNSEPAGTMNVCEELQVKAAIDYYIGRHPDSIWINFKHGQNWKLLGGFFPARFERHCSDVFTQLIVGL